MLRAGATRRDSSNSGAVTIQGRFYALALGAMVLDGEAAVGDVLLSGGLSLCHQDEADFGGGGRILPAAEELPVPVHLDSSSAVWPPLCTMRCYELMDASAGISRPGPRQWSANYRHLNDKVLQLPFAWKRVPSFSAALPARLGTDPQLHG